MAHKISREYHFSAAHRLEGHEKCGRLHGHNYQVLVEVTRDSLMEGMVMDYAILDKVAKPIIGALDHRYLVSEDNIVEGCPYAGLAKALGHSIVLPISHSTAEEIARWIAETVDNEFQRAGGTRGISVSSVTVCETAKSAATYAKD